MTSNLNRREQKAPQQDPPPAQQPVQQRQATGVQAMRERLKKLEAEAMREESEALRSASVAAGAPMATVTAPPTGKRKSSMLPTWLLLGEAGRPDEGPFSLEELRACAAAARTSGEDPMVVPTGQGSAGASMRLSQLIASSGVEAPASPAASEEVLEDGEIIDEVDLVSSEAPVAPPPPVPPPVPALPPVALPPPLISAAPPAPPVPAPATPPATLPIPAPPSEPPFAAPGRALPALPAEASVAATKEPPAQHYRDVIYTADNPPPGNGAPRGAGSGPDAARSAAALLDQIMKGDRGAEGRLRAAMATSAPVSGSTARGPSHAESPGAGSVAGQRGGNGTFHTAVEQGAARRDPRRGAAPSDPRLRRRAAAQEPVPEETQEEGGPLEYDPAAVGVGGLGGGSAVRDVRAAPAGVDAPWHTGLQMDQRMALTQPQATSAAALPALPPPLEPWRGPGAQTPSLGAPRAFTSAPMPEPNATPLGAAPDPPPRVAAIPASAPLLTPVSAPARPMEARRPEFHAPARPAPRAAIDAPTPVPEPGFTHLDGPPPPTRSGFGASPLDSGPDSRGVATLERQAAPLVRASAGGTPQAQQGASPSALPQEAASLAPEVRSMLELLVGAGGSAESSNPGTSPYLVVTVKDVPWRRLRSPLLVFPFSDMLLSSVQRVRLFTPKFTHRQVCSRTSAPVPIPLTHRFALRALSLSFDSVRSPPIGSHHPAPTVWPSNPLSRSACRQAPDGSTDSTRPPHDA